MTTPQEVLDSFWAIIDAEPSDMWHDIASVGWVADDIVLAVFINASITSVFYKLSDDGLHGVVVPHPHRTMFNVRDPRGYVMHRLSG